MSRFFLVKAIYWKNAANSIIRTSSPYLAVFCYCIHYLPTTILITSNNWKIEGKINVIMTTKNISTTCILIIYWLKNVLVESRKNTYHSVTLNCSKTQSSSLATGPRLFSTLNYHARLGPLWQITLLSNKHKWER